MKRSNVSNSQSQRLLKDMFTAQSERPAVENKRKKAAIDFVNFLKTVKLSYTGMIMKFFIYLLNFKFYAVFRRYNAIQCRTAYLLFQFPVIQCGQWNCKQGNSK